jgi:hypothetical protein
MAWFRVLFAWLLLLAIPVQGLAAASMLYCAGHGSEVSNIADHVRTAESAVHEHTAHLHSDVASGQNVVEDAEQLADAGHTCGVCASCCSSIAVANPTVTVQITLPLMAPFQPLTASVAALPVSAPERPPRA